MRFMKGTALVCALVLTACGGAGNSASGNAAAKASSVDINHLQQTVTTAQSSLSAAQTALSAIFNPDGSFNWGIFLNGVNFSNLSTTTQTCIQAAFPMKDPLQIVLNSSADIAAALTCIFNDVVTVAGIASGDLNTALTTLNSALAQATPGSAEATMIQSMIDEVNTLQSKYTDAMTLVANEMNIATNYLDNVLPNLVTSVIPIPVLGMFGGMAVQAYLMPIVVSIQNFQKELKAL